MVLNYICNMLGRLLRCLLVVLLHRHRLLLAYGCTLLLWRLRVLLLMLHHQEGACCFVANCFCLRTKNFIEATDPTK